MRSRMGIMLGAALLSCWSYAQLPSPTLKAVLIMKIAEMERTIANGRGELVVYVLGAPELAAALKEYLGKPIGKSTLSRVVEGDGVPSEKVDLMFVGTNNNLERVIKYAREKKVMTITDRADLFQKGLSVSILTEKRRPKISLNPGASIREGLDWDLDFSRFQSLTLEFKKSGT